MEHCRIVPVGGAALRASPPQSLSCPYYSRASTAGAEPGQRAQHHRPTLDRQQVRLRLDVSPGERFFGLGERMGPLSLNGQLLHNWSEDRAGRADAATSYSPAPFLLSSRGYGLLLDTTAMIQYDLRKPDRVEITASTAELPVHVITGPGSQASVTGRSTGDQHRSWDRHTGIGSVLPAMLSGSISGWPYWGPDIAGFFDGDGSRDVELWTRWTQLGALSPVMRDMLGAQADLIEVFSSEDTLATFAGYARLHQALMPYLHELAEQANRTGLPLIRPRWLAEPADPVAWTVEDAYLLGADLLVAPVVTQGARNRPVYLPAGQWRDYWTGDVVTGARWISADAPVQQIPLYVRAGTDLALPPPATLGLPAG